MREMANAATRLRSGVSALLLTGASVAVVWSSPGVFAQEADTVVITCLGDSVTSGAGSGGPQYSYPSQMKVLLQNDSTFHDKTFAVHNRAHGGEVAESIIDLLQTEGLPEDPAFVLLMIGGNDIAEADIFTLQTIINNTVARVQTCVDLIKAHTNADGSHPTLIVSTFIPNLIYGSLGSLAISLYNNALLNPGKLSGYDLMITSNWVDFYDTGSGHAKKELMSDDVHPNADGYAVLAANWFDALCSFPSLKDTDGDGLMDDVEDADGDGVWDEGVETDFNKADTDGDGLSDYIEVTCAGVAAAIQGSVTPSVIRINYQPPRAAVPGGYLKDGASAFSSSRGLGWLVP